MTTSDLDIYRSARALIEQHGEDAPIRAAQRADELLEAGDMDGVEETLERTMATFTTACYHGRLMILWDRQ